MPLNEVREALAVLQQFVTFTAEELDELGDGEQPAHIRARFQRAIQLADDLFGKQYARNRRMALVYQLVYEEREAKRRPTTAEIAAWPLLPKNYRSPKALMHLHDAVLNKGLRDQWLDDLMLACGEAEKHPRGGPQTGQILGQAIFKHLAHERMILGVDPE